MLSRFTQYIADNQLFSPSDKILLAISGGADSMVMAHLFYRAGFSFSMAHCNFMLRGIESDGDEWFCSDIAARLGKSFFSRSFDTENYASAEGISVQMAARDLRYQWFQQLKNQHGFYRIATAHHLDDHTETILINLTRGTGIDGLTGISSLSGDIIRPMKCFSGIEIREYARNEGVPFREDSSNSDTKYVRNKIRHQIIPLFREINPSFDQAVNTLSLSAGQVSETFGVLLKEAFSGHVHKDGPKVSIEIDALARYPHRGLVVFELLKTYGFSAAVSGDIARALNHQSGKVFYSPTHQCVKDRRYLFITPVSEDPLPEQIFQLEDAASTVSFPGGEVSATVIPRQEVPEVFGDPDIAFLDMDRLSFPLTLRNPGPGDSFIPFGMKGKKKISDYLTDQKVPLHEKAKVWLLCNNEDILWVVGYRTDNRYRVDQSMERVLKLNYHRY